MALKTIIIGGVAGGATTAARLRRRDETMQIIMLERGAYISYANCGLPYYIGDVIQSRDALLLQTPAAMKKKFNIDVRILSEVIEISPSEKNVKIKNLENGEIYTESYDNLVIATGSSPLKPPIKGIEEDNIFTLWTIPDTDRIKNYILQNNPRSAVVIGGGFIGLEMAENLKKSGLKVTIVEMQSQVMPALDSDMANLLQENIVMNDVDLILGDGVTEFKKNGNTTTIILSSGKEINADMVILSIGVRPNSILAKDAGIKLNSKGGIVVDEYLQTSAENVYAVGDVIEVDNFVSRSKTMIPLAGPANRQARILADNLTGSRKKYNGTLGTSVVKVFDLNAASTGLNEKQLAAMGKLKRKDYETVLINQKSHAGYYPGATMLTLKMIFDLDGKILGAEAVGQDGVDKRIDILATAIRTGADIYDLTELELAYAPPFSSAKDPVNMLGFVAENILDKMVSFIEWDEVDQKIMDNTDDFTVLDVTEDMERMVFSIKGSYHIPLGQLRDRLNELDKNKLIIPYCAIGVRSYNAARILMQNGFEKVAAMSGGTTFYKSMHYNDRKNVKTSENTFSEEKAEISAKNIKVLNCCGLQCPGPIMKVSEALSDMKQSELLKVSATDMGFSADIESFCRRTGNTLVKTERENKENIVYIRKGTALSDTQKVKSDSSDGKTIVVFSGDLDRALASFIIANGAASMGRKVTMFFTFWGLNILRNPDAPKLNKPFMDKMFGGMMPKGTTKLKLSKLNMGGMGTAMMKKVMKDKNVDSLEILIKQALSNGVKLVACTMSMDIMGIKKEELIEGVTLGGVASYLGDAEESNVNLFI